MLLTVIWNFTFFNVIINIFIIILWEHRPKTDSSKNESFPWNSIEELLWRINNRFPWNFWFLNSPASWLLNQCLKIHAFIFFDFYQKRSFVIFLTKGESIKNLWVFFSILDIYQGPDVICLHKKIIFNDVCVIKLPLIMLQLHVKITDLHPVTHMWLCEEH